jgi:hypothetical protein
MARIPIGEPFSLAILDRSLEYRTVLAGQILLILPARPRMLERAHFTVRYTGTRGGPSHQKLGARPFTASVTSIRLGVPF